MPAENFVREENTLRQILAQESHPLTLPNLVPVPNALERWWRELTEKVISWLERLLAPLDIKVQLNPGDVIAYLKWALIAILVSSMIYLIYRLITDSVTRRKVMHLVGAPDISTAPTTEPDRLDLELQAALKAGNYSLAARVRWVVFLFQNRLSTALTLLDYATLHPDARSQLFPHYALMFRAGYSREPLYQEFEKTLLSLSPSTAESSK